MVIKSIFTNFHAPPMNQADKRQRQKTFIKRQCILCGANLSLCLPKYPIHHRHIHHTIYESGKWLIIKYGYKIIATKLERLSWQIFIKQTVLQNSTPRTQITQWAVDRLKNCTKRSILIIKNRWRCHQIASVNDFTS